MSKQKFHIHSRWKIILNSLNLDETYILNTAGLPLNLFSKQSPSLNSDDFFRLWQTIEKTAGINNLGLRLENSATKDTFTPAVLACLCSSNLKNALLRLAEYEELISPIKLKVIPSNERLACKLTCSDYNSPIPNSFILYKFAIITQVARTATKTRISPQQITLQNLSGKLSDYCSFFSSAIINSSDNCLFFSKEDILKPFYTYNSQKLNYLLKNRKDKPTSRNNKKNIVQQVKNALFETLPAGIYTLDIISAKLSQSKRNLQRHLKSEKINFQKILDQTRKELSIHYLSQTGISVKETAYLLGYQNTNAFQRAFKKWTGTTPQQFKTDSYYITKKDSSCHTNIQ